MVCDTSQPGRDDGALDVEWVAAQLVPDVPTVIAMHHPPLVTGMQWVDDIGLPAADSAALAALLERSPQVKLVVAGHIHRAATVVLGGCAVVTCASTNIQGALDFEATEMVLAAEPPSILVHAWLGAGFVTHVHPWGLNGCRVGACAESPESWSSPPPRPLWAAGPASAQVVISEFRARGPAGGNDEFVELRNISAAPGRRSRGWVLQGCASTDAREREQPRDRGRRRYARAGPERICSRTTTRRAAVLRCACRATRPTGPAFTDFLASNFAGLRIDERGRHGDRRRRRAQSPCREGPGITTTTVNGDKSYERVGGTVDTNNNTPDFQGRTPSNPQNREQTGRRPTRRRR